MSRVRCQPKGTLTQRTACRPAKPCYCLPLKATCRLHNNACSCMLAHVGSLECALSVYVQTSTGDHTSMLLRHWQLLDAELAEHAKAHVRETR